MVLFAPAEGQEWVASDHLATYQDVLRVALTIVVDVRFLIVGSTPFADHLHQVFVVAIDEDGTLVLKQKVVQLAFGLAYPLKRSKALQVGAAYIGDQSARRLAGLYQGLDVARMRGSHLHHSDVVAVVQTEQRLGHSHIVVEVALRSHHVVFFSQHGAYQLLSGCLAVGTCDAYDGQ